MYFSTFADILLNNTELTAIGIAIVISLCVEFIVGWRLNFGILGAFIISLLGIWVFVALLKVTIPNDPQVYNIPIYSALIGGILFVAFWHLLTFRNWKSKVRYHSVSRRRYKEEE